MLRSTPFAFDKPEFDGRLTLPGTVRSSNDTHRAQSELSADTAYQYLVVFFKKLSYILCFDKFLAKTVVLCRCDTEVGQGSTATKVL